MTNSRGNEQIACCGESIDAFKHHSHTQINCLSLKSYMYCQLPCYFIVPISMVILKAHHLIFGAGCSCSNFEILEMQFRFVVNFLTKCEHNPPHPLRNLVPEQTSRYTYFLSHCTNAFAHSSLLSLQCMLLNFSRTLFYGLEFRFLSSAETQSSCNLKVDLHLRYLLLRCLLCIYCEMWFPYFLTYYVFIYYLSYYFLIYHF